MHTKSVKTACTIYHSPFSAIVDTLLSSQISFLFHAFLLVVAKCTATLITFSVQLLKPSTWEKIFIPTHNIFCKLTILKCFCKRTNKIQHSTVHWLKTIKLFELTWPLRKQPLNSWMLLFCLQKNLKTLFFFKNRGDWIISFQAPQFD